MEGILIMDYWMVLPIIVMVVTSLIMRIQRHLGETWKPGDDGPILARVGGANLPIDGGGTGSNNFFFVYFFGGLECVGHSFAYVAHL